MNSCERNLSVLLLVGVWTLALGGCANSEPSIPEQIECTWSVKGVNCVVVDSTELRQLERELEQTYE